LVVSYVSIPIEVTLIFIQHAILSLEVQEKMNHAILQLHKFNASKYLHETLKCSGSLTEEILRPLWEGRGGGGEGRE
jgi:hypothetical protein